MKTKNHYFAPGVLQRQKPRRWLTDQRVEQIARVILALALLATLVATLSLAQELLLLGVAL